MVQVCIINHCNGISALFFCMRQGGRGASAATAAASAASAAAVAAVTATAAIGMPPCFGHVVHVLVCADDGRSLHLPAGKTLSVYCQLQGQAARLLLPLPPPQRRTRPPQQQAVPPPQARYASLSGPALHVYLLHPAGVVTSQCV